ncbi:hypothetical protein BH10BDE1_BH10BDE1_15850 [soil metagenome]
MSIVPPPKKLQSDATFNSTSSSADCEGRPRQQLDDGVGPLYHRSYTVVVESSWAHALTVMRQFQSNLNDFSPKTMCRFEKTKGDEHALDTGDEFQIHITGPWNGPVRVAASCETSFTLATLEGHMEAGEIRFSIEPVTDTFVRFKVESFAKSKDAIVDFIYDKIPIAKFFQTEMWRSVCGSVAERLRAERNDGPTGEVFAVEVKTERRDEETGQWMQM